MPRAIAIETSGRIGSIAAVEGQTVVDEQQFPHGLKHAAEIIPIIDSLCRSRNWKPTDIEELYVSTGPGSFTGLRIAITLAKTMAFATGVKIVAVPSLRVLVENAPPSAKHVIIVLDAKRDQIFTGRFERASMSPEAGGRDEGSAWVEAEPAHLNSLKNILAHSPRPMFLLGEGIPYHEKFLPKGDPNVIVTGEESWRARAAAVAKIGLEMSARGEFADPYTLTPLYVRKPEAEEKYDAEKKS